MKHLLLLAFSLPFFACYAQDETALVSSSDTYIGYSKTTKSFTVVIEDLRPETKSADPHISQPDFKEENDLDYVLIDFDKNDDGKVNKGDLGFRMTGVDNHTYYLGNGQSRGGMSQCAYLMYDGWPGDFMNNISRGCENKSSKAALSSAWQVNDHSSDGHPTWKITVPLKEIIIPTSKRISVRVKVYRRVTKQVFSYPITLDNQNFTGLVIPLSANAIAADEQKEKAAAHKAVIMQSQKHYVSKLEYDGMYVDMGNGKYAELTAAATEKGGIAASAGTRITRYIARTPYVGNLSTAVVVPAVKKIVLKGAEYDDAFISQLRFSPLEEFNAAHPTLQKDGRTDNVRVYAVAGYFGSEFSTKEYQPDVLYIPSFDKTGYMGFASMNFDVKTLPNGSHEIYPRFPMDSGRLYVLWNNDKFWIFQKK